jgi:hypothetical protein
MKKMNIITAFLFIIFYLTGCATTRYDIKPEVRSEILRHKETKQVSLILKYYKHQVIRPMISRSENPSPDPTEIEIGKKFFGIVKSELKNQGFNVDNNSSQKINVEMGFNYKKGIPLLTTGYIATRWKVNFKQTPIFEIADFKLLADRIFAIDGVYKMKKGEELATLIVKRFIEELEGIK